MRKLIVGVLSTVLVLGAAGPALSAPRATSAAADVPCSEGGKPHR